LNILKTAHILIKKHSQIEFKIKEGTMAKIAGGHLVAKYMKTVENIRKTVLPNTILKP